MKTPGAKSLVVGILLLLLGGMLYVTAPRAATIIGTRFFLAREQAQIAQIAGRARNAFGGSKGILTRVISDAERNSVSRRIGARLTLRRLNDLPPDFQIVRGRLKKDLPFTTRLGNERIAAYLVLRGARGVPHFMLRADAPRSGLQQVRQTFVYLSLGLAAVGGVACGIGLLSLMERRLQAGPLHLALFARSLDDAQQGHDSPEAIEAARVRQELESIRARLKENEESYRQMALNASDVLYAMYPEAGRIEWLGQIDLMLGYAHGSFPRTVEAWADSIHPEEAEKIIALYTRACDEGEEFQVEYRMRHRNGSYRDWSHRGKPVYGSHKKLLKLVGACTDITEKKRAENRLRASEERLARIVETVAEAIVMVDREGIVTFANPAAELVFGANRQDIVGRSYADERWKITQTDGTPFSGEELPYVRALSTEEAVYGIEHSVQHASGQIVVVSVNAAPLRGEDGKISGSILSLADITDRKANEDRLMFQAFHDPLTKLPNRALFVDRLGHALVRCRRSKTMVAVFFIDLDNFKKTNDTLGHDAGDDLLIATAQRVLDSIRSGDTGARLAGDEFTIMLDNITDISQALVVANRLLNNMLEPVMLKGHEVHAPPSIGVALGNHEDTPDSIMKRADGMMYQAKKNGKARYEVSPHLVETTEAVV
ncbi:MAG TPA: diguanylate cyclase [Abditibacteriaceae bacterium]|jgi:diguanylate cyclase (GGDEF)-like protein/PAS domain S-box-containing protein